MTRCTTHGLLNCALCCGQSRFIPRIEEPTWRRPTTTRGTSNHEWQESELEALEWVSRKPRTERHRLLTVVAQQAGVTYHAAYNRMKRVTGEADHWSHGRTGGLS